MEHAAGQLDRDERCANGPDPSLSWECGDTDANVASGADDAMLTSDARAIAALGKPVMIRWFWEMEFTGSNGGTQGARSGAVLWAVTAQPGMCRPGGAIVDAFRANGATNVALGVLPGSGMPYAATAAGQGPGRPLSITPATSMWTGSLRMRFVGQAGTDYHACRRHVQRVWELREASNCFAKPVLRGPTRHSSYPG